MQYGSFATNGIFKLFFLIMASNAMEMQIKAR